MALQGLLLLCLSFFKALKHSLWLFSVPVSFLFSLAIGTRTACAPVSFSPVSVKKFTSVLIHSSSVFNCHILLCLPLKLMLNNLSIMTPFQLIIRGTQYPHSVGVNSSLYSQCVILFRCTNVYFVFNEHSLPNQFPHAYHYLLLCFCHLYILSELISLFC